MGTRDRKWPTKGQALIMGLFALLLLASNAVAVLWEGRPATGFYWVMQVLNLAFLAASLWLYRRAVKSALKGTP
jgi:hypothetical protein